MVVRKSKRTKRTKRRGKGSKKLTKKLTKKYSTNLCMDITAKKCKINKGQIVQILKFINRKYTSNKPTKSDMCMLWTGYEEGSQTVAIDLSVHLKTAKTLEMSCSTAFKLNTYLPFDQLIQKLGNLYDTTNKKWLNTFASYIWDMLSYNYVVNCSNKKVIIVCPKENVIQQKDKTYKLNIPLTKTLPLIEFPEILHKKEVYIVLQGDEKKTTKSSSIPKKYTSLNNYLISDVDNKFNLTCLNSETHKKPFCPKNKYKLYSIDGTYITSNTLKKFDLEKFKVNTSLIKDFLNTRGKKLKLCNDRCPTLKKYPEIDDKTFSKKLREVFK